MFLSVNISKYPLQQTSVCIAANEQGFLQCWELVFRPPEPLLIENMMMKLITNAQLSLSSPEPMTDFAIC